MRGIVGRDAELLAGDEFLRTLDEGPALLLEGEPGIGKTAIWVEIAKRAEAAGLTVLRSRPAAAETSLTLSALSDLLEPVPTTVFDALPLAQRRAIDAALLRTEPTADALEQRLLATACKSVLLHLADARPVVVAIDDIQWMDRASMNTLD